MTEKGKPVILGISGSLRKDANTDKLMQYISTQFEGRNSIFEWVHPKDFKQVISNNKLEELGTMFTATPPSILPTCKVV